MNKETVWLSQDQMAQVFDVRRPAITKHLANIFKTNALDANSVRSILEHTAADGKTYQIQAACRGFVDAMATSAGFPWEKWRSGPPFGKIPPPAKAGYSLYERETGAGAAAPGSQPSPFGKGGAGDFLHAGCHTSRPICVISLLVGALRFSTPSIVNNFSHGNPGRGLADDNEQLGMERGK